MKHILFLVGLLFASLPAAAETVLSTTGTNLGRIARADIPNGLAIIPLTDEIGPVPGFIVARFQNNQPVMRTRQNGWQPWDGDPATLELIDINVSNGALYFGVDEWPTADVLAPCTFTVGHWSNGQMLFGYFTVDGM